MITFLFSTIKFNGLIVLIYIFLIYEHLNLVLDIVLENKNYKIIFACNIYKKIVNISPYIEGLKKMFVFLNY